MRHAIVLDPARSAKWGSVALEAFWRSSKRLRKAGARLQPSRWRTLEARGYQQGRFRDDGVIVQTRTTAPASDRLRAFESTAADEEDLGPPRAESGEP